jgi:hypothetical protein
MKQTPTLQTQANEISEERNGDLSVEGEFTSEHNALANPEDEATSDDDESSLSASDLYSAGSDFDILFDSSLTMWTERHSLYDVCC